MVTHHHITESVSTVPVVIPIVMFRVYKYVNGRCTVVYTCTRDASLRTSSIYAHFRKVFKGEKFTLTLYGREIRDCRLSEFAGKCISANVKREHVSAQKPYRQGVKARKGRDHHDDYYDDYYADIDAKEEMEWE